MVDGTPVVLPILIIVGLIITASVVLIIHNSRNAEYAEDIDAQPVRRISVKHARRITSVPPPFTAKTERNNSVDSTLSPAIQRIIVEQTPLDSPDLRSKEPLKSDASTANIQRQIRTLLQDSRQMIESCEGNIVLDLPPILPSHVLLQDLMRDGGRRYQVLTRFDSRATFIGASTIHSFFRFPDPIVTESPLYSRPRLLGVFEELDTIIIDSYASVESHLLYAMDWCLRRTLGNNEAFGGKRVVMLGSPFDVTHLTGAQLSPIVQKEGLAYPVLASSTFKQAGFAVVSADAAPHLNGTYDNGREIVHALLTDTLKKPELAKLVCRTSAKSKFQTTIVRGFRTAADLNGQQLMLLETASKTYQSTPHLKDRLYDCPAPPTLELRLDAIIVFLTTNLDGGWHRGMMGKVTELFDSHIEVQTENDQLVRVEPETWHRVELISGSQAGEFVYSKSQTFRQLPVQLGWYVSVDSIQDMQLHSVVLPDTDLRPLRPGELLWILLHVVSDDRVQLSSSLSLEECLTAHQRV